MVIYTGDTCPSRQLCPRILPGNLGTFEGDETFWQSTAENTQVAYFMLSVTFSKFFMDSPENP